MDLKREMIDSYVTLSLDHVAGDTYKAKLIVPFQMRPLQKVMVALCDLSYTQNPMAFANGRDLQIDIAIPRYCSRPGPEPGGGGGGGGGDPGPV